MDLRWVSFEPLIAESLLRLVAGSESDPHAERGLDVMHRLFELNPEQLGDRAGETEVTLLELGHMISNVGAERHPSDIALEAAAEVEAEFVHRRQSHVGEADGVEVTAEIEALQSGSPRHEGRDGPGQDNH